MNLTDAWRLLCFGIRIWCREVQGNSAEHFAAPIRFIEWGTEGLTQLMQPLATDTMGLMLTSYQ